MLQTKMLCEILAQTSVLIRSLLTISLGWHVKECALVKRNAKLYEHISTKKYLTEISLSIWSKVTTHCSVLLKLYNVLLGGRVKTACSLELRNVYNKLETSTALDLKWFQMLRQSAENRTAGSPTITTR